MIRSIISSIFIFSILLIIPVESRGQATIVEGDSQVEDGNQLQFGADHRIVRKRKTRRHMELKQVEKDAPYGVIVAPIDGRKIYTKETFSYLTPDEKDVALNALYDRLLAKQQGRGEIRELASLDPLFVTPPPHRTTVAFRVREDSDVVTAGPLKTVEPGGENGITAATATPLVGTTDERTSKETMWNASGVPTLVTPPSSINDSRKSLKLVTISVTPVQRIISGSEEGNEFDHSRVRKYLGSRTEQDSAPSKPRPPLDASRLEALNTLWIPGSAQVKQTPLDASRMDMMRPVIQQTPPLALLPQAPPLPPLPTLQQLQQQANKIPLAPPNPQTQPFQPALIGGLQAPPLPQAPPTPMVRFPLQPWQIPPRQYDPLMLAQLQPPTLAPPLHLPPYGPYQKWDNMPQSDSAQPRPDTPPLQPPPMPGVPTQVFPKSKQQGFSFESDILPKPSRNRPGMSRTREQAAIPLPRNAGGFEPEEENDFDYAPRFARFQNDRNKLQKPIEDFSIDSSPVTSNRDIPPSTRHEKLSNRLREFVKNHPEMMKGSEKPSPIVPVNQYSFSRSTNGSIYKELDPLNTQRSHLSPNDKLALCCRKQTVSQRCQEICNFDSFNDKTLVTAFLTAQCPGPELGKAFDCASSKVDHTECCLQSGLGSFLNGRCLPFCMTHRDTPPNVFEYLPCLQVFDKIRTCYRDYQMYNKNLFGD